jgi:hypothetical protein
VIAPEYRADESTEDERALEGKYLIDRDEEVQKQVVTDESGEESDEETNDDDDDFFS